MSEQMDAENRNGGVKRFRTGNSPAKEKDRTENTPPVDGNVEDNREDEKTEEEQKTEEINETELAELHVKEFINMYKQTIKRVEALENEHKKDRDIIKKQTSTIDRFSSEVTQLKGEVANYVVNVGQPVGLAGLSGPGGSQGELWSTVASRRHTNKEGEIAKPPEVQIAVTNSIIDELKMNIENAHLHDNWLIIKWIYI